MNELLEQPTPGEQRFAIVYNIIESRLNRLGEITTDEVWQRCCGKVEYVPFTIAFRQIMLSMVEQGKAMKIRNGRYKILKPNDPTVNPYDNAPMMGMSY